MKNTKSTIKFFLVIALFASSVSADDGQMNGGGKTCNPQIQTCFVANQPGDTKENSIIVFVKEFLASLLG